MQCAFLLVAVLAMVAMATVRTSAELCQHYHSPQNGFHEVKTFLGSQTLTIDGIERMIDLLLLSLRCDQVTPSKCQCLTGEDVFTAVGVSKNEILDEPQFNNISSVVLSKLSNFPESCVESTKSPCSDVTKSCSIKSTQVQDILLRMNATTSGCTSVTSKMFNAMTVMSECRVEQISSAETWGRVSALIISKLIKGQCIVALDQLPHSSSFTAAIFHDFANNKTCTIQEDGYNRLMASIGSVPAVSPVHTKLSANRHDINDVRHKCFNRSELIAIHKANLTGRGLTSDDFVRMAPALLQQLSQRSCGHDDVSITDDDDKLTQDEMYGYGTLIVLIINLGALPGGLFAPFRDKPVYKYMLACMMGVAAGTLLGDGLLHLVPDALELDITQATPDHLKDTFYIAPYKLKLFLMMGAAYLFFVMELIFAYIGMHKKKVALTYVDQVDVDQFGNGHLEMNTLMERKQQSKVAEAHDEKAEKENSPLSLAYMIIIGDGIHNFADGLAIGAALHVGWRSGLSTSLAIFCHEVPHELGDFAALLSVGWSYKKSLVMNFVSGMTAFAGLYVGIIVSDNLYARQWIFAATAGMFLYISLSDLVPELLEYFKSYNPFLIFIVENIGFLIGMGIMVIITLYEDYIQI